MMARILHLTAVLALAAALGGCSPVRPPSDQVPLVQQAFEGFKDQVSLSHAGQALAYLDQPTQDYLRTAITRAPGPSDSAVDLLIRRAAQKLSPGGIGPDFKLEVPLQKLMDKVPIRPADLAALGLGPVAVDATGNGAHAEALWAGTPTTLQVVFVRDSTGAWKIDLLNLLTYASTAMTMDRTIKRETEDQQVDRLLRAVPAP